MPSTLPDQPDAQVAKSMDVEVAEERDGEALVLVPIGRLVFRISGFDQIIPIRDTRESALAEV